MKKRILRIIVLCTTIFHAQSQGDIAFVGYNGDGDDDFAILVLVDIPAHSTIYFTDSGPDITGTGMDDLAEGVITWTTGSSEISAGTVVTFTDIDNDTNAAYGVSVGQIERSKSGFSLAVGTSGDEIFATLGDPAQDQVSTWLAGIEVHNHGRPANFDTSGLIPGANYLVIDTTQSKDGGEYTGVRSQKTADEYRRLVNDQTNWTTDTEDGEKFVPFNTSNFTFLTLTVEGVNSFDMGVFFLENKKITTDIGEVKNVYNVFGQCIENQNLTQGLYIVEVKKKNRLLRYKFAF